MEARRVECWMIENIEYVTKFLKFGLQGVELEKESENERLFSVRLLEEVTERITPKSGKFNLSRSNVEMKCGIFVNGKNIANSSTLDPTPQGPNPYANVLVGERSQEKGTLNLYCKREHDYEGEGVYVCMNGKNPEMNGDSNELSNKEVKVRLTCKAEYVNIPVSAEVGSTSKKEGQTPIEKSEEIEENAKLFMSSADIEDKWKKISTESTQCAAPEFQQEAIHTLNTMRTQSSVYIKKDSFGFGYLYQRKRILFGHTWKRVYAVIKNNVMFLYRSEFEDKALEIIILNGYNVFEVKEKSGKEGFQLVPVTALHQEDGKTRPIHRFRCDSADFEVWQQALSFPVRQTTKDKRRDMAWLKIAQAFDHSSSDENVSNSNTAPLENINSGRRKTEPIVYATPQLHRRPRSRTDYLENISCVSTCKHSVAGIHRSAYPLPF